MEGRNRLAFKCKLYYQSNKETIMAKKIKKFLKKAAKVAVPVLGALALAKRAKSKAVSGTDDAGINVKHFAPDDYNYTPKKKLPFSPTEMWDNPWGAKGGGIAKRGTGAAYKKGGRVKSMGIAKRGGGAAKR